MQVNDRLAARRSRVYLAPGFVVLSLLAHVSVARPVPAAGPVQRTFSDVREIEESGDLVGTELTLRISGETVTGTLRHYEGAEPEAVAIAGRLVGKRLTLSGTYSEGKLEIDAVMQKDRLVGKLSYHLTGQTNVVELNLPRVERPRMLKAATRN